MSGLHNGTSPFRVGSLYAGVGGICLGFKNAGFEMAWANEWDARACQTYRHNFDHRLIEGDVWKVDLNSLEPVDVLTAGFPCQPFSVAGYRKGFDDDRGNHFFRILEFVDHLQPKVVFLENVKNLATHDKGNTFKVIGEALDAKGYRHFSKVLNTKDYGNIPHNRERIFIVAFKEELIGNMPFEFPEKEPLTNTIHNVLHSHQVDEKFYYRKDRYMFPMLESSMDNRDTVYQWRRVYVRENKSGVCPTLTANMGTGGHNVPLINTEFGIRKLTPHECFAFQGFPVTSGDYKLPGMAASHLYKQAGNSVSVPVIERLAECVFEVLKNGAEPNALTSARLASALVEE